MRRRQRPHLFLLAVKRAAVSFNDVEDDREDERRSDVDKVVVVVDGGLRLAFDASK